LVRELDTTYFDLRDSAEEAQAPPTEWRAAFSRARLANAVLFALSDDSLEAATEAIYEASAATGDLKGLRAAVLSGMRGVI